MSAKAHYFRIGLFVLIGVILVVAGVIVFGAGALFRKESVIETYVDESVQGLDVGAPVKYRGVQVGQVKEIGLVSRMYLQGRTDSAAMLLGRSVVIRMGITQFPRLAGHPTDAEVQRMVSDLAADGFRVRLASQGITGVAYMEMDFVWDPPPPIRLTWEPAYPYLPSAPSTMTRFTQSVEEVLQKLSRTEIDGLVSDARSMVQRVDGAFREADLKALAADIRTLVKNLDGAIVQARLPEAVADVRRLARSLDAAVQDADLKSLSADARQVLQRLDGTVRDADLRGLSADARQLLQRLEAAVKDADVPGLRKEVGALVAGAQDALRQLDVAAIRQEAVGLLSELRQTNRDIQGLVAKVQVEPIMADIQAAVARVKGIVGRIDEQLSGREIENALRNMAEAAAEIASASKELGGTIQLFRRKLSRVDAAAINDEIEAILESLRRVTESLERITGNAERYPSQVLFGEPPPQNSAGGKR